MATTLYQAALELAASLPRQEQLRLIAELAEEKCEQATGGESITELRGLGREIWSGIDAQEYVDRERASWNE
jgi:hypothetical protein